MFALSICPAVGQCIGMLYLPESPRYLLLKQQEVEVWPSDGVVSVLNFPVYIMEYEVSYASLTVIWQLHYNVFLFQARTILEKLIDGGRVENEIDSMKYAIQNEKVRP